MLKRIIIGLFFAIFLVPHVHAEEQQSIGIVPFYAPEKIWILYSPLIVYLNKNTDTAWELKLYRDHDSIIKGLCSGEISIALLGPVPFGRAHEQCGARPLLVALGSDGRPVYRSILVTGDEGIKSIEGLKGKKIGFYKGSTAASVLPRKMLDDEGISLYSVHALYFNSQDRIIEALLKHEIDAAGIKQSLFERFNKGHLKSLRVSEPLPNFVFSASPSIDPAVEKIFVKTLMILEPLSNPAHKKIVEEWDDEIKHGFVAPPETYLGKARQLLEWYKKYN